MHIPTKIQLMVMISSVIVAIAIASYEVYQYTHLDSADVVSDTKGIEASSIEEALEIWRAKSDFSLSNTVSVPASGSASQ